MNPNTEEPSETTESSLDPRIIIRAPIKLTNKAIIVPQVIFSLKKRKAKRVVTSGPKLFTTATNVKV